MTVNDLIGKIEKRIRELGAMDTYRLRMEHVDVEPEATSRASLSKQFAGRSREDLIADIIVDEFSTEYDAEIDV